MHEDAPIKVEILGYKKFEVVEALFNKLFSNVLDGDVRLGSNPNFLTRIGVPVAYDRSCDDRRFARSGRTLNYDNSIVVLVREDLLDSSTLRGIEIAGEMHRDCFPLPFELGPQWLLLGKPQGLEERI